MLLMELLIENGPEDMLAIFTAVYNMVMKVERERFIGTGRHERAESLAIRIAPEEQQH